MKYKAIVFDLDGVLCNTDKYHYLAWKQLTDELGINFDDLSEKDLLPEIKDTLDKLRAKKLKLAIGSSSKNTKLILKQLGLGNYFDAISDGTNIHKSKPDPEVYLKASIFLNIQPQDCLVVEDALSGIQAATAAGMDCAAIGDGVRYNLARYSLNTFSELLNIV